MITLASKRILVTGGSGFLGGHLLNRLRGSGAQDVFAPSRRQCDFTQAVDVERLFSEYRPQVVIHAAASVGGIGANKTNPGRFFFENAIMGLLLIDAARRYHVEKTVVIGTICSYPRVTPIPFREEDLWNGYPEEVTAPYGIAKKAILVHGQTYRAQYGTSVIFLMPCNLYGPGDHFNLETSHVVPSMILKFAEAKRCCADFVTLWGDGSATREFLFAEDAADGIVRGTELYDKPEPVNLGTGKETSIRELAEMTAAAVGFKGGVRWDTDQPNGQPRRCLDVSRAEAEFGFRARTTLDDGLARTVQWYAANVASLA